MLADFPDSLWTLFAVVMLFFPLLHVAISKRAQGMEVVGWLILVLVSSYLGWAIYLIVTSRRKPTS